MLSFPLTLPVVSARGSEHHIMVVLGEGGGQALLAGAEPLMAPGPALAELPVAAVLVIGRVDGQVLAEHVAAACDVPGLLQGVGEQAPLVAVGARLGSRVERRVTKACSLFYSPCYYRGDLLPWIGHSVFNATALGSWNG